jgi:hypothetical protein
VNKGRLGHEAILLASLILQDSPRAEIRIARVLPAAVHGPGAFRADVPVLRCHRRADATGRVCPVNGLRRGEPRNHARLVGVDSVFHLAALLHAPERLHTIYKSQTFPTTGFGHVYNLKPDLAAKVKEGFFSFPWEGSALKKEFEKSGEAKFIPITYKGHWDVVRKIDAANNVSYKCK